MKSSTQEAMLSYLNAAPQKLAPNRLIQRHFPLEIISAVLDEDTGKLMEYRKLMKKTKYRNLYRNSYEKEIGRLAQGMPGLVEGTNTMFLIDQKSVPINRWRDVTYGRVVVYYCPEKSYPCRTRLTVGVDRVNYPGDFGTPTMSLTTVKLLLNSIFLTLNAHFMTIAIKYFYLNTPMARIKYIRLKLSNLPKSMVK